VTQFIQLNDTFRLAPTNAFKATAKLPAGTYTLKIDRDGYYLDRIQNFDLPKKLYGDCLKNVDRIINTFWDRPNSTGVFLEGEKGSGKTLLTKAISLKLIEGDVPTIVINEPHCGEAFNTLIQSIDQPKVVLFDEFEKTYQGGSLYQDEDDPVTKGNTQEKVLTLFDGVYPSKTLFLVTCNDSWKVDKNMKNRPGRMYYMLTFKGLDEGFIREYAEENLNDKTQVDSIVNISVLFGKFNFDMLKAMVEEMNRYSESAQDVAKILNTKPSSDESEFDIRLYIEGEEVKLHPGYDTFRGNPLTTEAIAVNGFSEDMKKHTRYNFKKTDLRSVDGSTGSFMFLNGQEQKIVLLKKKYEVLDWTKFVS
jgi:SpoVK/Ycf46/Vps4 family AAA+-type ATPase